MERHIQILLNRLSFASITIATVTLIFLFLQTPKTCVPITSNPKPHHKFPKSTCDFSHRSLTSIDKKNKKLWSSKDWIKKVNSFSSLFHDLQTLNHLNNRSRALCVSAGAGHEVMAMKQIGLKDVTGVELVDSPPLVSRADPHNLPFFDGVFDLGFSAQFDRALFPRRYAEEMERTVRAGGACVVAVEACGDVEVKEVASLFRKSRFVRADNFTLIGSKMTRIILRVANSS
ncbi:S-adenosyl-L-methionine-dependent methyltransferases superfamily protein [Actinidia rufa]|uniref:S-adenosyl-L-methionine-dependent methyltransferases superfamily protein n=1 Tax=Actinidia rufa TaxID=165716 RepID=A0A7J0G445_9ERIC|nr:S-adenosyl-L-methionine-dependent methyltransferases superfamily protein [Actinidia rufa]